MVQESERGPSPSTRPFDYPDRSLPKTIPKALKEDCHIPTKVFFLFVLTDDNREVFFSSSDQLSPKATADFFNPQRFLQYQHHKGVLPDSSRPTFDEEAHGSRGFDDSGRRLSLFGGEDHEKQCRTRKRQRGDGDGPAPVIVPKKPLVISDTLSVSDFYGERFRNCQQTACKLIAKAWIKAIEPRKQSNYPYTGPTPPPWWPEPWDTKDGKVRHKEPDHLLKRERVNLLKHILSMIVLPSHQQYPTVREQKLNVAKLEDVTTDALNAFFTDTLNPNNVKKMPFLKELFYIAKAEEKWRNGELDGDAQYYVMADDNAAFRNQSDDDDSLGREEGSQSGNVSERAMTPRSMTGSTPTSAMTATATRQHGMMGGIQGGQRQNNKHFMADPPVRDNAHQYVPPIEDVLDTGLQPHGTMVMGDIISSHHDQSRRPSLFSSPPDFAATPSPMYRWPATDNAPPSGTTMYPFAPVAQQQQQQQYVPHHQQYMDGFDGLPRTYEAGQANMFRGGVPPMGPPHGSFPGYALHHDERGPAQDTQLGRGVLH